jgi:hypothetical protein
MADPFSALNRACVGAFGVPVSYQAAAGGAPIAIRGVFQKDTDTEREQDAPYAHLFICLADLPARPERGDEATVNGETFAVFQVLADAIGGAWLSLRAR